MLECAFVTPSVECDATMTMNGEQKSLHARPLPQPSLDPELCFQLRTLYPLKQAPDEFVDLAHAWAEWWQRDAKN